MQPKASSSASMPLGSSRLFFCGGLPRLGREDRLIKLSRILSEDCHVAPRRGWYKETIQLLKASQIVRVGVGTVRKKLQKPPTGEGGCGDGGGRGRFYVIIPGVEIPGPQDDISQQFDEPHIS